MLILIISVCFAGGKQPNDSGLKLLNVRTELGVSLSEDPLTIVFIVENNSKNELKMSPLGTSDSRIVLIKPDGTEVELFAWAEVTKFIIVKPGESFTQKMPLERIFTSKALRLNGKEPFELNEKGKYNMYWKIGEVKSNQILILKE
ncbi:MAG: hypothetical protein A2044_00985 [Candidatus Firestonebacteria bacterium GWA2_43_8]|nr:MAG: hypothetical protein A2044_00985 [Candidatus Firestonebacteria bacterium GWA2_43_8]